ncbi:apoptosis-antagonizing transcription factor [Clohesyomyces aquaticus]|uniref:Protein BFR2 n=1 Tax=Clohesyomyces aquaticus TaxID=1231657 RepID=A0A1Y1Z3V3_9PLEO|nr:apoptosis-antagonizing transcription factor [Clohesyomyces aquaticus]
MKKSKFRDFDPESILDPAPDSSSDSNSAFESDDEVQDDAGREHYADVGKSRLRRKEAVPLGPQYEGAKISRRDTAEEEDSDDPFARPFIDDEEGDKGDSDDPFSKPFVDDEEEEDEDEGGDVVYGHGVGAEGTSERERDEDDDSDEDMDDSSESGQDDDDEDSDGSMTDHSEGLAADQAAKLRDMMKEQSSVVATISQAAKADVDKGKAIKSQRKTFDGLLNTRIRLQKALISTNSMSSETYSKTPTPDTAISAAETAALTLLNNLTNLRSALDSNRTGQKRKRPTPFTSAMSSAEIWSSIQSTETPALRHRNAVLEKWSSKTKSASLSNAKGRLNTSAQQTLTDVLNSQLSDTTRLVKRTQMARSCAPLQASANVPSSEHIYDDADFYGLLLKELLEQRSNDLSTANGAEFVVQAPWQVAREAKTKKIVDTKASKGRKLRYTVQEKLQNFMAPEERGTWGERQRDELFASLFGRRVGLGEEDEGDEEEADDDIVDAAEEGLMLFRS